MDAAAVDAGSRQGELWRRLSRVTDPELDETVVDMGFVERAEVRADGTVEVDFRLPTYWCSPNFAFLMLDDMRIALEALSWRPAFRLRLHDHMFAEEVNEGLAAGRSFPDIFGELASDETLDEVRTKFRGKAFRRRQEAVLLHLRRPLSAGAAGGGDGAVLAMDLAGLDAVAAAATGEAATAFARYREALVGRFPDIAAGDPAFRTFEGGAIRPETLDAYMADLRAVRINMEFSGALCRGLKDTRYKELELVDGEPTLVDFMLDRVPPRGCGGAHP